MKIGLISCTKRKNKKPCKARDMYSASAWFRKNWQYLERNCDKIFIMSAKYGLLDPEEVISPYNETLNTKTIRERKIWSYNLIKKLEEETDLINDNFIILGGKKYSEFLKLKIKNYTMPLEGVRGIGNQMRILNQWLKK